MDIVSLPVADIRKYNVPSKFENIIQYYFIKYSEDKKGIRAKEYEQLEIDDFFDDLQ